MSKSAAYTAKRQKSWKTMFYINISNKDLGYEKNRQHFKNNIITNLQESNKNNR